MANPSHFTPGRVDAGSLAGETVPVRHPEAIVEVDWTPVDEQSDGAELAKNQAARVDGTRAYAVSANDRQGIRQEFVGMIQAGDDEFPIIAVSDGVSGVRDFVLVCAAQGSQHGATPIARIPRHGYDEPVQIGRHPSAHTGRLPSLSDTLSSRHAKVYVEGGHPVVIDAGSTNGTTVLQPNTARAAKATRGQSPFGPAEKWAMQDHAAQNFRPAYPPAIPESEGGTQRVGIPEVIVFRNEQPTPYTARINHDQPPLETRAMGAETFGLDGKRIAIVELAPGQQIGDHAEALYVYDRGTNLYDGQPPKPFQPGGRPLTGDQRFVVVTEQFLADAQAARASGDYSEMRNHKGMIVLDRNATRVWAGRNFWQTSFGEVPRSEADISPEHAELHITSTHDAAEVRVIDKASQTGTRLVVPKAGTERVVETEDTGMTRPLGAATTGHTLRYPSQ